MLKNISIITALLFVGAYAWGQQNNDSLFEDQKPLDIGISISIKKVANSKGDTDYIAHKLYYRREDGITDSIKVGLKGRGNFRLQECYFPPLWMHIEKKDAKGTLFAGNKKLKLVMPCYNSNGNSDLILKEYLCYKLYEEITPNAFRTRLVNIDLTELRGKKNRSFKVMGILIEDVDKLAARVHGKPVKTLHVNPHLLNDTSAMRFDLFQFMISNTDWSKSYQHNSKLISQKEHFIPVPYDFDLSGVVDAPYAVVSMVGDQQLPIESVIQRYYRGYCRSDQTTDFIRKEFLSKEDSLLSLPGTLKGELTDKTIARIKDYLGEFFMILKNEDIFQKEITAQCRSLN